MDTEDFCSCDICFFEFGARKKYPRILSCGHTFCQGCIQRLIDNRSDCPNCNIDINYTSVEDIPINYLIKGMSDRLRERKNLIKNVTKTARRKGSSVNAEELCNLHALGKQLKCLSCSLLLCPTCIELDHQNCNVVEAMDELQLLKNDLCLKIKDIRRYLEIENDYLLNSRRILDYTLMHIAGDIERLQEEKSRVKDKQKAMMIKQQERETFLQKVEALETQANNSDTLKAFQLGTNRVNSYLEESGLVHFAASISNVSFPVILYLNFISLSNFIIHN